ncbi:MAG: flagellar protein FlaG [Sulfuriferula sp.]
MIIQNIASTGSAAAPEANAAKAVYTPPAPVAAQPSPQQLRAAVETINQSMQYANQNLQFSVDADTNRPVVSVVDSQTGDLVMQFPSKAALAVAQSIDQYQKYQSGLLLNHKA